MSIGADIGTYNLAICRRNENNELVYKREVNAFLSMELENDFMFNMMKKAGVPLIHREDVNVAYALGEAAMNMAYVMSKLELKRPMKNGCVNPGEHDAFEIMNIMIHSMLGEVSQDKELLYYSVPANAINKETDADYHGKLMEAIFRAYKSSKGYTVEPRPIKEGMALIYAELENQLYTGLGISFGAGMVNVSHSLFGVEVFSFSLVNSGDWIDEQAAKATNETIAFINRQKHKINLDKEPINLVERAIKGQYELMVEKTVTGIKKGMEESKERNTKLDKPIDIVIAGGSASPPGFDKLFERLIKSIKLPVEVGNVIRPQDPLLSVSRGCLMAAESAGSRV